MPIERVLLQDFINDICILVDNNYEIEFEQIGKTLHDNDLQNFLLNKFPANDVRLQLQFYSFIDKDWNLLEDFLRNTYNHYGNKLGIKRNGLLLFIGLANSYLRNVIR